VDGCGRSWTWKPVVSGCLDACGHCLEIYGSEGWGFESLRACYESPCYVRDSARDRHCDRLTFGSHVGRTTSNWEITLARDSLLEVRFVPPHRSSGSGQARRLRVLAYGIDLVSDEAMSFPVDGVRRL
jgi:hypothetical protein